MKTLNTILNISPLIIFSILAILVAGGRTRFGAGLADFFFHGLIYNSLLSYSIYLFVCYRKGKLTKIRRIIPIALILFAGFLLLKMSFWRGSEYKWNGNFLAPKYYETNSY